MHFIYKNSLPKVKYICTQVIASILSGFSIVQCQIWTSVSDGATSTWFSPHTQTGALQNPVYFILLTNDFRLLIGFPSAFLKRLACLSTGLSQPIWGVWADMLGLGFPNCGAVNSDHTSPLKGHCSAVLFRCNFTDLSCAAMFFFKRKGFLLQPLLASHTCSVFFFLYCLEL